MTEKVRILFLAANPKNTVALRLDEEIREIQSRVRSADFRDHFELISRWAVRPNDLLQALNEVRPHIVHFSGHGSKSAQLKLEDRDGNSKPVSEAALVTLFRTLKDNIRLVLINACNSESQAKAISGVIECTIGMNDAIGDEAAIVFAEWFYGALAFGRSIGEAYEQGRTALMLNGIDEESTPILLSRPGSDPLRVSFADRRVANPVLPPLAFEILQAAVSGNTPINLARYDGGVAVLTGNEQFDSNRDLERAALLDHAVAMLAHFGWIRENQVGLYHVTHAGYETAHRLHGQVQNGFRDVMNQMPDLIAEMRQDLQREGGQFVREFFVMSRKHSFGGSEKPRFTYYEEDHDNLRGKLDILENHDYIMDVTPKNVLIYRMSEEFVKLLLDRTS